MVNIGSSQELPNITILHYPLPILELDDVQVVRQPRGTFRKTLLLLRGHRDHPPQRRKSTPCTIPATSTY
jgi:hypothetical protein